MALQSFVYYCWNAASSLGPNWVHAPSYHCLAYSSRVARYDAYELARDAMTDVSTPAAESYAVTVFLMRRPAMVVTSVGTATMARFPIFST